MKFMLYLVNISNFTLFKRFAIVSSSVKSSDLLTTMRCISNYKLYKQVHFKLILTLSIWSRNLTPQIKRFSVTTLPPLQMPFTSPGPAVFLTHRLCIRASHNPILRPDNLVEGHTELRKALYCCVMLYDKGLLRNSHKEEMQKARHGDTAGSFCGFSGPASLPALQYVSQPESSLSLIFQEFL